ncbi:MAG: hypothetical protein IAG13_02225 [Deltaproteobacteria bacterium]|nr:hypothetical protein [Nannocystaceae bacterium]
MSDASPTPSKDETRVLIGISWVFLVLGVVALGFFLRDPSISRHPQLMLIGTTALIGSGVLRLIAKLVGAPRPEE